MNGNDFEARFVDLKLCGDSKCNNVINSFSVVEPGTLNFDVAKTLTVPKVVGKAGQFVKVVDSVTYPALASDADLSEDQFVELSSSIKKIESETVTSASPSSMSTASATATAIATEEAVAQEGDITATEIIQDSKSSSLNMIILIFGIVIAILLIVLLIILMKRKK
jgi:cobalamin biosynthesis Mg chelatase CobN